MYRKFRQATANPTGTLSRMVASCRRPSSMSRKSWAFSRLTDVCAASDSEYNSALPDGVAKPPRANGRQSSGALSLTKPSRSSRS